MLESYGCDHNGEAIISEWTMSPTGLLRATRDFNLFSTPDYDGIQIESLSNGDQTQNKQEKMK